jgi:hypothetical protein
MKHQRSNKVLILKQVLVVAALLLGSSVQAQEPHEGQSADNGAGQLHPAFKGPRALRASDERFRSLFSSWLALERVSTTTNSFEAPYMVPRLVPDPQLLPARVAPTNSSTLTFPSTATAPRFGCEENGSCYGDISPSTWKPKTVHVQGYFRKDGTYVRGHYRSR